MNKKVVKLSVLLVLITSLISSGYLYLQHTKLFPSTDDAYIQANVVYIAPQITGRVSQVYVKNLQRVSKGQLLFDIDTTPFRIATLKAQADLDNTHQQVQASINAVAAAEAAVTQRKAELDAIKKSTHRTLILVHRQLYPAAAGDIAIRDLKVAQAALITAQNQLLEAKSRLGESDTHNASIRAAEATLAQTKLALSYTHVYAPNSGYIVNFNLRQGTEVNAYQEVFAIIDDANWWATANFKETQLARIYPGQLATIQVDMYPNHLFHGKVVGISAGSGASFALLPPENATGNWVKVTQRFPVRIEITDPNPAFPLRLGASTKVTINTAEKNHPV